MNRYLLFIVALLAGITARSQSDPIHGEVTFLTTQNVYVRFENTELLQLGDSLFVSGMERACLVVTNKSTTSCVCQIVGECSVEKGTGVTAFPHPEPKAEKPLAPVAAVEAPLKKEEAEMEIDPMQMQEIRARISASTYSTLAADRADRHRLMTRLMVNADHLDNGPVSVDLNANYRHILDEEATSSLARNDYLRVYGLSVTYEASPTLTAVLGRNINPKFSSLGPIDGLQVEKRFGNHYAGAIVGFRPDIYDFGFNPNLLEYGGYYGIQTEGGNFRSQTTLGGIEQRGRTDVDRRYAYLQHTSTINSNLSLFASAELDLFSKVNSVTTTEPRLTNLFASARYRFGRGLNVSLSYDSRKRIIYYDTYRSELDRILDDDLARQGIRARVNFRPGRYVFAGLSYARRFQADDQNKSDNYYGFLTLSRTPFVDGRTTLTLNRNESGYLTSNIAGLRHSRTYFRNRLQTDFYYRAVHSDYVNFGDPFLQHYAGADITYYLTRSLFFSITGEFATYEGQDNYRIYSRIVQRFHSKRRR